MEIYLRHRERNQVVCIQKHGQGSIEFDIYHGSMGRDYDTSYTVYEEETPDQRLNWYNAQKSSLNYNGRWISSNEWVESSKDDFFELYKNYKNSIHTFIDHLILK